MPRRKPKLEVKQPYFVTPHAMKKFRERFANDWSDIEIIHAIQFALQGQAPWAFSLSFRHHKLAPIYKLSYRGQNVYIPVAPADGPGRWPVVVSVWEFPPKDGVVHLSESEQKRNSLEWVSNTKEAPSC